MRELAGDPSPLGVASGDPPAEAVILWTRLAPDALADDGAGGMPAEDADVVQIFLGDPQSWRKPKPRDDAEELRASGLPIYVHAPYLINLASPNNKIRIPSRKILQQTCDGAAEIGAKAVIVHGGHVTEDDEPGAGFLRWRKGDDFEPGPWNNGRKYKWMNSFATFWVALITVIFCLPFTPLAVPWNDEFTWESFNYAPLMVGIVILLAAIAWFASVGPTRSASTGAPAPTAGRSSPPASGTTTTVESESRAARALARAKASVRSPGSWVASIPSRLRMPSACRASYSSGQRCRPLASPWVRLASQNPPLRPVACSAIRSPSKRKK